MVYLNNNVNIGNNHFDYYSVLGGVMCSVTELKDEFQKYMSASCDYYSEDEPITDRKLLQLWLDCANPREKKIQELEKENEKLKQLIEKLLWKGEL